MSFHGSMLACMLKLQITKKQVDSHNPESQTVPHCELRAKWLKREQQVRPLEHTVNILGTAGDDDYFTINIDSPETGNLYKLLYSIASATANCLKIPFAMDRVLVWCK